MSCARCGLTRGSEVTASDQQSWATAAGVPGPAPEPPAWQRWIRFWWIPVVLIALGIGWFTAARRDDGGALTEGGTVSVTDLRPGDCFNTSADEEEISDVDGVPCDESHEYEVYVVQDREGDTYPTDAEFDAIFDSICVSAFDAYVGADYATSVIYAGVITPSEGSWDDGDREYVCYLYEPVDPNDPASASVELTSSLEGAGR